jgi:hypothetical protein
MQRQCLYPHVLKKKSLGAAGNMACPLKSFSSLFFLLTHLKPDEMLREEL